MLLVLCGSLLLLSARFVTTAFVPKSQLTTTSSSYSRYPGGTSGSATQLFVGVPRIDEWEVLRSGAVRGIIANHPTLPDGYEITTSPLDDVKSTLKDNGMVVTSSGSKYKLLKALPPKEKKSLFGNKAAAANKSTPAKSQSRPVAKPKAAAKAKAVPKPKAAAAPAINYDLNGKVVGNGKTKYLLSGKLIRSSSSRSQIYYAYKADTEGNPSGTKLIVKLTDSEERLQRESKNYDRVYRQGRVLFAPLQGASSCYVRKVGYCPNVDDSPDTKGVPRGSSALILESGDVNLRGYLGQSKGGLTGSALRKAAVNICRCVEAMHSSGLVWTDLKAENFVIIGKDQEVKAIDLESAVNVNSYPEDYSPEACPPEFASAEKRGVGYEFKVLKNYDTWSMGMVFFELATGSNYFKGKSEDGILNMLAAGKVVDDPQNPVTVAGLEAIEDDQFRDLVKSCLSIDPRKRPSVGQILLHPYFLTTGFGPLTF